MSLSSSTEEETRFADQVESTLSATNQLLNSRTAPHYAAEVMSGIRAVSAQVSAGTTPCTGPTPESLHHEVSAIDLDHPLSSPADALAEVERVYLRDAVYFHDVKYAAHLNCPVAIPALVGEAVLSAVNTSMDTWDQSTAATHMEQHLIQWTAERLGLGDDADGVFTSGGSQSNLQALLMARNRLHARLRSAHPDRPPRLADVLGGFRIFASDVSHFSVQKSAAILGLGPEAVVVVPSDGQKRMDTDALEREVARCRQEGLLPMAVVGTAGTTDFGSFDPLVRLADICGVEDIWLHIDAAYGGGLITSQRHRHLLAGTGAADSVTIDFHKTFFQPVSSSAILVRDRAQLEHVTYYADYLNPPGGPPNQVDKSLQTTRRFDALKLWLTLRTMGADAVGALLDEVIELATGCAGSLGAMEDFDVVVRPAFSTVVFRYLPPGAPDETADRINQQIRSELFDSGEAIIGGTIVEGRHYLKFTLLNAETTMADVKEMIELIRQRGSHHLASEAMHHG
ncbi:pyridoxal phosphate-dependent decarboxylase family protein [Arthrobacter castelli]|uniref:pyridoxal phosphate-dependent decarboxylase family protein n=1 Tax=Arthrobacter castelli TaxID=271431 RepID=UPI00042A2DEC|nr:aspartate aminotransferase family protein [Arthrobacter castelli]